MGNFARHEDELAYHRRWYAENAERIRPVHRQRKKGTICHTSPEARRRWREKNPEKNRAYAIVTNEIRRGRLVRPSTCEDCGTRPGVNRGGRSLIHGHHEDYSKPLEIRWLCVDCHKKLERIEVSHVLS